jgi:hypothetical protein
MKKEYNITLGLTSQEISSIKDGEHIKFNFLPTELEEFDDRISISIKEIEEDSTLSDSMNLVVDNLAEV